MVYRTACATLVDQLELTSMLIVSDFPVVSQFEGRHGRLPPPAKPGPKPKETP